MKHKHTIMLLVAGWLLAMVFPPDRLIGKFRGGSKG